MNYRSLFTFNCLEEGTVLHNKPTTPCSKSCWNKFARGNYLELSKLVYIYLMGKTIINGKEFSLAKPTV